MKGPVKKEETKKESFAKKEQKDKKLKAKGILLHSWLNRNEQITTTEEAKVACKARKRKERQESISSLYQERKVIRSNSEERPHSRRHSEKDSIIRRVSSSEDLHIQNIKNKRNQSSKENSDVIENNSSVADECEHEKRRSHERFAKPLTLKCKKSFSKRPKGNSFTRTRHKVDERKSQHEPCTVNIQINEQIEVSLTKAEKDRSPSPHRTVSSTSFDLSTLHQQVDDSEPLPSCSNRINNDPSPSRSVVPNRLLSSPRNSIIATHCIYLDPDICAYNNGRKVINPIDEQLQKLSKQLGAVKKKIKKFENDFQLKNGYKPSHFDKINDGGLKKYYMELTKLKKEYKLLQESGIKFIHDGKSSDAKERKLQTIMTEIEMKLETKREYFSRNCEIEKMTQDQLSEEKVAVQKALLHLENVYGRPIDKDDRDLVRPLYDRYRTLKRLVSKASMGTSISNDLETIHEDETANFDLESTKSSETVAGKVITITDSDTDVSINGNLHAMDQEELRHQIKIATEEKKVLKRTIKEYELSIQQKTGKMVQKEDKQQIQQFYKNYKTVKSKIRLLDALISKQY